MLQETNQPNRQDAQAARIERTRQRKMEQGLLPTPEQWASLSFSHTFYEGKSQQIKEDQQAEKLRAQNEQLQKIFARKTNERAAVSEVADIAAVRFDTIIGTLTDPNVTAHNNYEDKTTSIVLGIPLGGMKEKPTLAQQAVIEFVRQFGGAGVLAGVPKKEWERTIRPELVGLADERIAVKQSSNRVAKK